MVTLRAAVIVIAGMAIAYAQSPELQWKGKTYRIDPARVVADQIQRVMWSPDGLDIAYLRSRQDTGGSELGVFNLAQGRGFTVAVLDPEEKIDQVRWLNAGHRLLFVTRDPMKNRTTPTDLLRVRVADARALKSRELWSEEAPTSDSARFDIEISPSLAHAILTLRAGKTTRFLVLTLGGDSITESADLEAAERAGQDLAGWSTYGTAIFAPQQSLTVQPLLLDDVNGQVSGKLQTTLRLRLTSASDASNGFVLEFGGPARPDIELGATTFECVPGNGVLRQIRFPGYFEEPPRDPPPLRSDFRETVLQRDLTTAKVRSLWLIPDVPKVDGKVVPVPGLPVSAEAEAAWTSPAGRSIAFTCHGALFVRSIIWSR